MPYMDPMGNLKYQKPALKPIDPQAKRHIVRYGFLWPPITSENAENLGSSTIFSEGDWIPTLPNTT